MKTTILELNQRIEDAKARYVKLEKLTERVYWTDLKLHDAVAVFKHDEDFERFCDANYEYAWLPELEDKGVHTISLTGTSKFIISSDYFKQLMYNYNGLQSDLLSEIFFDTEYITDLENLNTIQFLNEYKHLSIDDLEMELGQIEDNMDDLEKGIKQVSVVYRWLAGFKKNQVRYALEECFDLAECNDKPLSDYLDIEWVPEHYPKQYEEFLKNNNLTHKQVVNGEEILRIEYLLHENRQLADESKEFLEYECIKVAHNLIKGATVEQAIERLNWLKKDFENVKSQLIIKENELMSQLLELKGE